MDTLIKILTIGLPYLIKDPATLAKVLQFVSQIGTAVTAFEAGNPATFTFGPESITAFGENIDATETLVIKKKV